VTGERGYAMAALLVGISIMALIMSMAMPAWKTMAQREKEAELFFRGQQYARAVAKYQAARGAFPPSIDVLVNEKFLRKKYKDPITNDDFDIVRVGQAPPGQAGRQGQAGQAGRQGQAGQPSIVFQPIVTAGLGTSGGGPILGVVSKSTATTLRLINGKNKYNEITFVPTEATTQAGGVAGTLTPGGRNGTPRPTGGTDIGRGGRGGTPTPSGGRGLQLPSMGVGGRTTQPVR
jgi:type II secretory pathway pseudopilin PulG